MKAGTLADLCLVSLVAGLAALAPPVSLRLLALLCVLLAVSFLPALGRAAPAGGLRRDRALALLALVLFTGQVRVDLAGGPAGWWPLAPAGLLLAAGVWYAVQDRRRRAAWGPGRLELTLAVATTLVASFAAACAARAVLAHRSTAPMEPGRVDFLWSMGVWAVVWFGLDARLRALDDAEDKGIGRWLWERRHTLALCLAAGICALRLALRSCS